MTRKASPFFCLLLVCAATAHASDTLRITIRQADSIFLQNSFYLMASSMNIEAQRAQVIQAKLYPNPIVTVDFNAYDPENRKVLHAGSTGQKTLQFEQLIVLGGKRKLEIDMAKTNVAIAELELQQLTRNLKYQLHSSLYMVGQQAFLLSKYNQQLGMLDSLLLAYQTQVDKGNIALKELVRLKGAYLKLNNDRAELFKDYFETQAALQKILQVSTFVEFEFTEADIEQYVKLVPLAELQAVAESNRPDLLIAQQNNVLSAQYLQYQKRLRVPDMNVFTAYDQRGGAFGNQINAGVAIGLPVWNKNQGNINQAQFKVRQAAYETKALQHEISTQIQNVYAQYKQVIAEYQKATKLYNQDFDLTIKGISDNFLKRNVSMIEFIDFFEAYNEVLTELTRVKAQLVASAEELNMLAGKEIY